MKLRKSSRNFERGRSDVFVMESVDVGELTHVMMRKDEGGMFASRDWHLSCVEVLHPGEGHHHLSSVTVPTHPRKFTMKTSVLMYNTSLLLADVFTQMVGVPFPDIPLVLAAVHSRAMLRLLLF